MQINTCESKMLHFLYVNYWSSLLDCTNIIYSHNFNIRSLPLLNIESFNLISFQLAIHPPSKHSDNPVCIRWRKYDLVIHIRQWQTTVDKKSPYCEWQLPPKLQGIQDLPVKVHITDYTCPNSSACRQEKQSQKKT